MAKPPTKAPPAEPDNKLTREDADLDTADAAADDGAEDKSANIIPFALDDDDYDEYYEPDTADPSGLYLLKVEVLGTKKPL